MNFDKAFVKVHHSILYDLILAANFLNDKEILDMICQEVADRIKGFYSRGRRRDPVKTMLGHLNDFITLLITLKTNDDEEFKLDKSVAVKSEVIKSLVQDIDSNVIPLPNVDGKTMTKVINYWKKHSEEGVTEIQLKNFDQDFLKMSHSELFDVHLAARYLDDKQLEEVIIQESFDRITGKTLEEIREVFGIVNDYTPEEEEQVQKLITLKTSDGEEFKLDEAIDVRSEVIKNIVQDMDCTSNVIPLFNVDGKTMTIMVKYWKKHSMEGVTEDQLKNFDQDFLNMSHSELLGVVLVARYLDDKQLKKVIIQEFVDRITGKTLKEIREVYGIVNACTSEKEEEVRREYAWAFD
ncbi:hypothetical protein H5410_007886 [Solanum commersonii]|uniref:SKP1-like protein n=1 Tax=Solanum commersonii TaxID=4109 RepID=A0A9J6AEF8_SOLCO|nr:hypothetical protein H5410_007886 [Solanum commersonii]